MKNLENMKDKMMRFYTKEMCYNLYNLYLKNWIADEYIGKELSIFDLSMVDKKTPKEFFIDLLFEVYSDKEKFNKILKTLPKDIFDMFLTIIWETSFNVPNDNIDDYLDQNNIYNTQKLSKNLHFFRIEKYSIESYIYLDEDICKVLREHLEEKPTGYYLYDSTEEMKKETKLYIGNNEKEILNNLDLYFDFAKSGAIKVSNAGKILKESKKNMLKHCEITEYYGNLKGLEFLKTELLCMFFDILEPKYKNDKYFNISNIENILKDFISTKNILKNTHYPYTTLFLNHLKGVKNIWENDENLKKITTKLLKLITETDENYCISVENLITSFLYREKEDEKLITLKDAKDYLYINEATFERRRIFGMEDYRDLVLYPFIKSYLYLLGTLGLFELYYKEPENSTLLFMTTGYLTAYDGLKYIKLTNLGKYILGIKDTYEIPTNYEKSEVFLDDKRLIVNLVGESPSKKMFFEKISKKIGNNTYKVTADTFKKGIKNSEDLEEKLYKFKSNIDGKEITENWKEFFEEMLKKYNSIKEIYEYRILQLKNDKELLEILKKDDRLKNLSLKAENYILLVRNDDISKVIKIFKEYGYYIDKLNIEKM